LRSHLPLRGFITSPFEQAATHLPSALIFSPVGHAHIPAAFRVSPAGQTGVPHVWVRRSNTSPRGHPKMRMTGWQVPFAVGD
jgi:hypothetical protein